MKNIILSILCIGLLLAAWIFIIQPKLSPLKPKLTVAASMVKPHKALTPFSLIDTDNKQFNEKSLRGHWTLVFFGYTKCPDACPKTLDILRQTWSIFASKQAIIPVRFVFVDISPNQISKQQLRQFLHNYCTDFIGITGTSEQIHTLSDQLGIYSQQGQNAIDHTVTLMLINPHGSLYATFTPPLSAEELAHDLTILTL